MMAAIGLWLHGMIRAVQIYEAEIDLWRAKKGLPPSGRNMTERRY